MSPRHGRPRDLGLAWPPGRTDATGRSSRPARRRAYEASAAVAPFSTVDVVTPARSAPGHPRSIVRAHRSSMSPPKRHPALQRALGSRSGLFGAFRSRATGQHQRPDKLVVSLLGPNT